MIQIVIVVLSIVLVTGYKLVCEFDKMWRHFYG